MPAKGKGSEFDDLNPFSGCGNCFGVVLGAIGLVVIAVFLLR